VIDVSKEPQEFKKAPAQDPLVKVSGPSVVYVEQNKQVRVLINWLPQRAGQVTVPLRAVDDRSGPLLVGLKPIAEDDKKPELYRRQDCLPDICSDCMNAAYTCCAIIQNASTK